ncbi:MAG: FKBP-type peptidyl-prolyl cis-trans isomerase [Bacteroidales bacterium]|jgi:FKBP-type peptidyl-prolyl cis-trans isomerase SlyD|nr:FKBP-type peptidyl-prolyl cis-trans isomerase [Bacteroidales bacterium]
MKIEKDNLVALTYTLRKDGADGEIIEVCDASHPLEFIYDTGMMLPHFEKHLNGLEAGSTFAFTLSPEEAYGEFTPEAIVAVSKDIFIIDGTERTDLLEIGKIVPMRDAHGNPLNGRILTIDNEKNSVNIDFNHPLAGQTLYFEGKIESVRVASEEELQRMFHSCGGGCGGGCGEGNDCESGCDSGCCCN